MELGKKSWIWTFLLLLAFSVGCAGIPVREPVKVDLTIPVGKIEGNQFTGMRYPFRVAAPSGWQVTTEYPKFMLDFGYEKEGLEESEVFIFNPTTRSNLQIDFSPADRYSTFDQEKIEGLVSAVAGGFKQEVQEEYGKEIQIQISPTEKYSLKGVPFAAGESGTYTVKGVQREQGWIYAFAEPYQIFILYMILGKEGGNDRQSIKAILDTFEYIPQASQ